MPLEPAGLLLGPCSLLSALVHVPVRVQGQNPCGRLAPPRCALFMPCRPAFLDLCNAVGPELLPWWNLEQCPVERQVRFCCRQQQTTPQLPAAQVVGTTWAGTRQPFDKAKRVRASFCMLVVLQVLISHQYSAQADNE